MSDDELDDLDDFSDDVSEGTSTMPPRRFLGLLPYLELLRDAAFTPSRTWVGTPPKLTMVMGNPSADLDSIVSSVVFSYFHNSGVRAGSPMYGVRKSFDREDPSRRLFMSLINMPRTDSRNSLQRLRPELGVALREAFKAGLSTESKTYEEDLEWAQDDPQEVEQYMCQKLLTIHDLLEAQDGFHNFHVSFQEDKGEVRPLEIKQELILVDHNAASVPSLSSDHISRQFSVTGCIDHHVDDQYVAQSSQPRIIQTGIGSCASLVVKYLRESNLWPDITKHSFNSDTRKYVDNATSEDLDEEDASALRQLSILTLAPILIDSSNLKAGGEKTSDIDRDSVAFLESQINSHPRGTAATQMQFNRNQLYEEVSDAKNNSLDQLTMSEIFDRDYKQWDEKIVLGISSIIKPISWLMEKPCNSTPSNFVEEITKFAKSDLRDLGIFVFSTRGVKDKAKELGAVAFTKEGVKAIEEFEKKAHQELDLEDWDGDAKLREEMEKTFKETQWKLWWMKDVTKTRKQVAPLMREAIKSIASDG